jgi:hypothetical protein
MLLRGDVKRELTKTFDRLAATTSVTYELKEYSRWLDSDFFLVLKGPDSLVTQVMESLRQYFVNLGKD